MKWYNSFKTTWYRLNTKISDKSVYCFLHNYTFLQNKKPNIETSYIPVIIILFHSILLPSNIQNLVKVNTPPPLPTYDSFRFRSDYGGVASGPVGFELRSGCSALQTMVMFGRKSASYCTHSAATAANWSNTTCLSAWNLFRMFGWKKSIKP